MDLPGHDKLARAFEDAYREVLGDALEVLHPEEAIVPHVEVHVFAPGGARAGWLLVTTGASATAEVVADAEPGGLNGMELACELPAAVASEVVRAVGGRLVALGEYPGRSGKRLDVFHTMSYPEPIAAGFGQTGFALVPCEEAWAERLSAAVPTRPSYVWAVGLSARELRACAAGATRKLWALHRAAHGHATVPGRADVEAPLATPWPGASHEARWAAAEHAVGLVLARGGDLEGAAAALRGGLAACAAAGEEPRIRALAAAVAASLATVVEQVEGAGARASALAEALRQGEGSGTPEGLEEAASAAVELADLKEGAERDELLARAVELGTRADRPRAWSAVAIARFRRADVLLGADPAKGCAELVACVEAGERSGAAATRALAAHAAAMLGVTLCGADPPTARAACEQAMALGKASERPMGLAAAAQAAVQLADLVGAEDARRAAALCREAIELAQKIDAPTADRVRHDALERLGKLGSLLPRA